ncbi:L-asparaginase [Colletotrichum orchidophilum]|uniref:asparaginase n=1 Tax=Colletotrichum orchidophilum TaxID=1209926 RepID=A0A1G4BNG2_9PEZI|nr:L-asparaginase [Colletotrichum orchidophilum]OHF03001.1 L-asparaginase [Colletotrichum orchidophilum]
MGIVLIASATVMYAQNKVVSKAHYIVPLPAHNIPSTRKTYYNASLPNITIFATGGTIASSASSNAQTAGHQAGAHGSNENFHGADVLILPEVDIFFGHQALNPALATAAVASGANGLVLAGMGADGWTTPGRIALKAMAQENGTQIFFSNWTMGVLLKMMTPSTRTAAGT